MLIYYLCFFSILFTLFIGVTKNNIKGIATFSVFSIFILVSGLRYQVGADFNGYYSYFKQEGLVKLGSEIGYSIFIQLSKVLFGESFSAFIFFQSVVYFFLLYILFRLFSKELRKNLVLPFFFVYGCQYFLGGIFGQSKQALAILIICYSLYFSYKKKFFPALISFFIATSIHLSTLVSFPILLLICIREKISLKYSLPSLLIVGIILSSFLSIFNLVELLSNLPFIDLVRLDFSDQVIGYLEDERLGSARSISFFNILENTIISFISIYSILFGNKILKILGIFYLLSPIFTFSFLNVAIFSQRLARVFKFVEIILIPTFFNYFSANKLTKFIFLLLLSILLIKPFLVISYRPSTYLPYKSIYSIF